MHKVLKNEYYISIHTLPKNIGCYIIIFLILQKNIKIRDCIKFLCNSLVFSSCKTPYSTQGFFLNLCGPILYTKESNDFSFGS